jgi:plasmid stabilization system protein ParE
MVLSLEREQRLSWILAEIFELSSEEPIAREAREIEAAAEALLDHPDYAAPSQALARVRERLTSGRYRLLEG